MKAKSNYAGAHPCTSTATLRSTTSYMRLISTWPAPQTRPIASTTTVICHDSTCQLGVPQTAVRWVDSYIQMGPHS